MPEKEKSALEKLEDKLKELWQKSGHGSIIAARHTEFVVEPKVFLGNNKLHPEILKALVLSYLANTSVNDSGVGNIEATPDKLVIKTADGKPMVIVRDKKVIQQYIAGQN